MPFIDLTHPITASMPVYPGDDPTRLETVKTHAKDGFTLNALHQSLHIGTHIDAPFHFIKSGKTIECYPIETFIGRALILDARHQPTIENLDLSDVLPGDIIVLRTDHSHHYNTPTYYENWPVLSEQCVKKLIDKKIRMLALDTPSPDHPPHTQHVQLLKADILIVENLTYLDKLPLNTPFELYIIPLRIQAEAAPVRVFAKIA